MTGSDIAQCIQKLNDENQRLRDQMQKAEVHAHELDLVNGQYELENESLRDALRTKEREVLEALRDEYANTGTFTGTFLMRDVPVIDDDLDVVLQRKIDALRAQQPSDPARETQGEDA